MGSADELDVAVIGAGLAGICAGIKLREAGQRFVIFDAADDIGGTWQANRYPGVAVDIPSVSYSYSFEPNPQWTRVYAPGAELKAYVDHCADKYALRPHLRLGTEVLAATFDETAERWALTLAGGETVTARFVIGAWGGLVQPKLPDIPGLDEFAGEMLHTSAWTDETDVDGRRVAVIGTGATSVQLVPSIAPRVSHLSVFQRTPVWVLPRLDLPVPAAARFLFRTLPVTQWLLRMGAGAASEVIFARAATHYRTMAQVVRAIEGLGRWWIRQQVADPVLREKLTPTYGFGCKRPTMSNAYLPAFGRDNVELVTEGIERVTADGVVTVDARLHRCDTLVLATGFKVFELGGAPPMPVVGRDGVDLGPFWDEQRYQSYEGVSVHGFPNLFLMSGPYALGGPSYIFMIETHVRHALRCITEAGRRNAATVEVRPEAHDAYFADILERQEGTVFLNNNCGSAMSYYFDRHGDAPILRPASGAEMWWRSRTFDLDHYEYGAPTDGASSPAAEAAVAT
ncbi:NAD(P)/FAD-dependent oxidoreductase [Paraconexibacter antarcticus]|uniref:NAD(P)/FAD-dependent oxidoreductase n=1 Tax=Paraconexibacter antarcticus TaxID=2949664 RepID=A0ABY5DVV3_9ACTN|nr:NAD(P)/FAD-dependent oxidoreductase [Paraconexibacter antarcticus]UTI66125.1 NAD(P)/FAD-dependent oxidoreductase [Paraconexibacter antarcticus]